MKRHIMRDALEAAREMHQRAAEADSAGVAARDARDEIIRGQLAAGVTQRAVATALGISPGMVARIAHGGRASVR